MLWECFYKLNHNQLRTFSHSHQATSSFNILHFIFSTSDADSESDIIFENGDDSDNNFSPVSPSI